jgi:hypothetical protein
VFFYKYGRIEIKFCTNHQPSKTIHMTVLEPVGPFDFETPTSLIPNSGYTAIGALGDAVLEEAAMRILFFSRERGEYVSVSMREIELQWNRVNDSPSLCKAVGGLSRLRDCIQILVDSGALIETDNHEFAPTKELVKHVYKASVRSRRLMCVK